MTPSKKAKRESSDESSSPEDLADGFALTLGRLIAAEILDELGMHKEAKDVLSRCGSRSSSTT